MQQGAAHPPSSAPGFPQGLVHDPVRPLRHQHALSQHHPAPAGASGSGDPAQGEPPPSLPRAALSPGEAQVSTAPASPFLQDSPDLLLLLRLLALGQGAWDMIDSQVFKEPKMVTGVAGPVWGAGTRAVSGPLPMQRLSWGCQVPIVTLAPCCRRRSLSPASSPCSCPWWWMTTHSAWTRSSLPRRRPPPPTPTHCQPASPSTAGVGRGRGLGLGTDGGAGLGRG